MDCPGEGEDSVFPSKPDEALLEVAAAINRREKGTEMDVIRCGHESAGCRGKS